MFTPLTAVPEVPVLPPFQFTAPPIWVRVSPVVTVHSETFRVPPLMVRFPSVPKFSPRFTVPEAICPVAPVAKATLAVISADTIPLAVSTTQLFTVAIKLAEFPR